MATNERDRTPESHIDDRILSYLSLLVALGAFIIAAMQEDAGRKIPFQSTLYETRVQAMEQYAKAHFDYDNSLRAFLADVPHPIGTPKDITESTDRDLQENAIVAHKVRNDHANYTASINAVIGIWPDEVQQKIGEAGDKAAIASQCIFILGTRTLQNGTFRPDEVKNYWDTVRVNASQACSGINDHKQIIEFQAVGLQALNLMRQQLRNTQTDLVPEQR